MNYVCSNCGSSCGADARMGAMDIYLVCRCAEKGQWINDGRGGYFECLNDAHPIPLSEYSSKQISNIVVNRNPNTEAVSWICSRCKKSNAPHVNSCDCK